MFKGLFKRILSIFGIKEVEYDPSAADRAREQVLVRTFLTGKSHVANMQPDGSWIVEDVEEDD